MSDRTPLEEQVLAAEMTPEEIDGFLAKPRYAATATLRRDGSPIVVAMGYVWREQCMYLSSAENRSFNRRLERDSRISCNVFNDSFPVAYVLIEGTAIRVADADNTV